MRAGLTERVAKVRAVVPEGCAVCRAWPRVRFLMEGEPEPPKCCPACGRAWHGLTRVLVIVRVEIEREDTGADKSVDSMRSDRQYSVNGR